MGLFSLNEEELKTMISVSSGSEKKRFKEQLKDLREKNKEKELRAKVIDGILFPEIVVTLPPSPARTLLGRIILGV